MLIYYSDIGKRELQPMIESQSRQPSKADLSKPAGRAALRFAPYLVLPALVALGTSGCDRNSAVPRGAVPPPGSRIVVIGPPAGDPAWPAIRGGARRCGEQTPNLVVETVVPEAATAAAYQRLIEQVLSRPPVAVCLYVPPSPPAGDDDERSRTARRDANADRAQNESAASQPAASQPVASQPAAAAFAALARDIQTRGVLLVTMGEELPPGVAFGHVGVDWPGGAELLGRRLKAIAPDRSSYVLLHKRGVSALGTECYDRFNLTASRELMTRLTDRIAAGQGSRQREQIRAMLSEFPAAGLVVTLTPEPWLEGEAERLPPENAIATLSAVPPLWGKLSSGEAAALVGPLDGEVGFAAVELAWQGLMGAEPAGRRRLIPCELVTPDARLEFERRYAEAAGRSARELKGGG